MSISRLAAFQILVSTNPPPPLTKNLAACHSFSLLQSVMSTLQILGYHPTLYHRACQERMKSIQRVQIAEPTPRCQLKAHETNIPPPFHSDLQLCYVAMKTRDTSKILIQRVPLERRGCPRSLTCALLLESKPVIQLKEVMENYLKKSSISRVSADIPSIKHNE